jgi:hypothetical protein
MVPGTAPCNDLFDFYQKMDLVVITQQIDSAPKRSLISVDTTEVSASRLLFFPPKNGIQNLLIRLAITFASDWLRVTRSGLRTYSSHFLPLFLPVQRQAAPLLDLYRSQKWGFTLTMPNSTP